MRRFDRAGLRAAYAAQHAALGAWLAALPAQRWDQPSVLAGWTVHDLAFHTTQVPGSLTRAIATGPVRDRALSIAEYTSAWRAAADDIADRDRLGARDLTPAGVVARHSAEHAALMAGLDTVTGNPVIRARRGPITVTDFLATRVNELVVHSRDLSASVPDVAPATIDPGALGVSVRMLLRILSERAPGRSVEVRVPPYAAIQCAEGPRHTRGTPPNVVELEPLAWVELATGRAEWSRALSDGRVSASGERADLAAYLPVLA